MPLHQKATIRSSIDADIYGTRAADVSMPRYKLGRRELRPDVATPWSATSCSWTATDDAGSAAGLFAGSQTLSASMGLASDAINRLGLPPDQATAMLNEIPVAYAVTYIFGTVGSALIMATLGPRLLRIDLVAECKAYELAMGGGTGPGGEGSAWHEYDLRLQGRGGRRRAHAVPARNLQCGASARRRRDDGRRVAVTRGSAPAPLLGNVLAPAQGALVRL